MKLKKGLKLNFKDGEKVQVSPVGEVIGLDGRGFKIDGEKLVANIKANELDIPLDANHDFDRALGWFSYESFEVRDDGIYAALEFTPKGVEANNAKEYRYLSPVYEMSDNRVVAGLDSVGFVNRPNLLNNPLNSKEINTVSTELKAELEALKTKNAELEEEKNKLQAQLDTKDQENEANEKNAEIKSIKEELEFMKTLLAETNQKISIFGKKMDLDPNNQGGELNDSELKTAKLLGLSADEYKTAKGDK